MTTNPLPGQDSQPAGITCPSCGHFVGALTRCPHCGTRVEKRMSVRVFRYAALVLGTVGLGLLYLMVLHREIPLIRIGEIKPTMNFAYVRVAGTVAGDPRVFKEAGKVRSLRFMVRDDTGEISVTAYRAQAEALVAARKVPRFGDRVEVAGQLSMTADDEVVMRLQVPEHLALQRAEMPVTPLAEVTSALVGNNVLVEGIITRVNPPRPESRMPWVIEIRDETGDGAITFWQDIYGDIRDKVLLAPGSRVRARISVRTYREQLQLMLNRGEDLELWAAESAKALVAGPGAPSRGERAVEIADVTAEMEGQSVVVVGRVTELRAPEPGSRAPYELVLEDEGSRVTVVYWDTVARHLGANTPSPGMLMKVRGMVDVYQDQVQIKVHHSDHLTLVDVEPPAKPRPTVADLQEIGSINASMIGHVVTLRGTLGESRAIKGGVVYKLSDPSGQIDLLLWDRQVPGSDRDALETGRMVKVCGEIGEFRGALQIVPADAQSVVVE